jgi:hypothetical protein
VLLPAGRLARRALPLPQALPLVLHLRHLRVQRLELRLEGADLADRQAGKLE